MIRKYLICVAVAFFSLTSCEKPGLDFETDDDFINNIQGGQNTDPGLGLDTVGIHKFLGDKYLVITAKEQRLLYYAGEREMYRFNAVALPEGDHPSKGDLPQEIQDVMFDASNNNTFMGFPTAVEINGKPLIVAERRVSEVAVNEFSDGVFIALDEQSKWQFTEFFKYAPFGNQFLTSRPAIGKTDAGTIAVKSQAGLMISNDNGDNWTHHPRAFDALGTNYVATAYGVNIAYNHKFNSLFFANGHLKMGITNIRSAFFDINTATGEVKEVKSDWIPEIERETIDPVTGDNIIVRTLINESGPVVVYVVDGIKYPDMAAYDGSMIAFSVHRDRIYQYVYKYKAGDTWDDVRFTAKQTTIQGTLSRQLPPGIIFNPVTKRFELIQSVPSELSLHSISIEELMESGVNEYNRAPWRKELSFLLRNIGIRGQGMYPVSSIVDTQRGVQRVYVHFGNEYPGRSGIFELTRTLNTPELANFVRHRRAILEGQDW